MTERPTCFGCGKTFRTQAALGRHKKEKLGLNATHFNASKGPKKVPRGKATIQFQVPIANTQMNEQPIKVPVEKEESRT